MSAVLSPSDLNLAEIRCEAMGDTFLKWALNDSSLDPAKIQYVDDGQAYINTAYVYLIFELDSDGLGHNEVRVSWSNEKEDLYFFEEVPVSKDAPKLDDFEDEGEWANALIAQTITKEALTGLVENIFSTPSRRNALLVNGLNAIVG